MKTHSTSLVIKETQAKLFWNCTFQPEGLKWKRKNKRKVDKDVNACILQIGR